jgi:thiosulfate reductase cytochrome b subunit
MAAEVRGGDVVRRHRLPTRLWHGANLAAFVILLMSGLMIFNAHPRLYWGAYGANPDPAWLEIGADGGRGFLRVGPARVDTTGVLGIWEQDGQVRQRAFPAWATIPSGYDLALARRWHLSFAWLFAVGGALYLLWSLAGGHLRRGLAPSRRELAQLGPEIVAHARLDFPRGAAALRYNVLQKLAYLLVLAGLIPLMVLTGLTMSPSLNATFPWLLDLFGGRQSARSIHFIAAGALVGFVLVHVAMVLLTGPLNNARGMITGRYRLPREKA